MNPRESLKKLAEQSAKIEELLNECVELYKQQGIEKTREEISHHKLLLIKYRRYLTMNTIL